MGMCFSASHVFDLAFKRLWLLVRAALIWLQLQRVWCRRWWRGWWRRWRASAQPGRGHQRQRGAGQNLWLEWGGVPGQSEGHFYSWPWFWRWKESHQGGSLVWAESLATMQTLGHNVTGGPQHINFLCIVDIFLFNPSPLSFISKRVGSNNFDGVQWWHSSKWNVWTRWRKSFWSWWKGAQSFQRQARATREKMSHSMIKELLPVANPNVI